MAAVPGARRTAFAVPRLPPLPALMPLIAAAEAARDDRDGAALEELALRLAGAVAAALAGGTGRCAAPSRRDERRVTAALRRIEAKAHEPLSLADLAREAAMSPYHFLRTFRHVVGMTPHQFMLRTRLHRAAVRLRRSDEADLGHRLRRRLQRPVDLQSPLPAPDGGEPRRLPGGRPPRRGLTIPDPPRSFHITASQPPFGGRKFPSLMGYGWN